MLCSVTGILFALLRWSSWGPVEVTNRLIDTLVSRGAIESDSFGEACAELRTYLEKLLPHEQRRFVYEVARHTFGGDQLLWCWDSAVTDLYVGRAGVGNVFKITDVVLGQIFESDNSTLRVVARGALACAEQTSSLQGDARRARPWLKLGGSHLVLAELLASGRPATHPKATLEDLWHNLIGAES